MLLPQNDSIHVGPGRRVHHKTISIDMTPMVDLGFLLIAFFIFTTSISEKTSLSLMMPKEGTPTPVKERFTVSALLSADNRVYVYEGILQNALRENRIIPTNYHFREGLGQFVRDKQKKLEQWKRGSSDSFVLLIKPDPKSSYRNMIDALDEAVINGVKNYAVLPASPEEMQWLKKRD